MALSASAEESDSRGTISGTIAAKIGQRIAKPMPLVKVRKSNRYGLNTPNTKDSISAVALVANQICANTK